MGHMPQPRFDFNSFIETAPTLLESRDIIDILHAPCEDKERILEKIADELYSVVPGNYPRKDVLWGTIVQTLSESFGQFSDDLHEPYVEKSYNPNLPDIVIEKSANEIRQGWEAMLIDLKDYIANQVLSFNRNAAPNLRIS